MELSRGNSSIFFPIIGILAGIEGLSSHNWFWSSLLYVGASWVFAAFVDWFADREVIGGDLVAAFILSLVGAVIWVIIDKSRTQVARGSVR